MQNRWRIAAFFLLILLLAACSTESTQEASSTKADTSSAKTNADPFPPMDVADLDALLAANKGKPVMLMFWTTWCPSCKQAFPELEGLRAARSEDELAIITVSLDEDRDALEKYYETRAKILPVFHGSDDLARKFKVSAIPMLLIFNQQGKLVFSEAGAFPKHMMDSILKERLDL